jgi:hypothetical protein
MSDEFLLLMSLMALIILDFQELTEYIAKRKCVKYSI